MRAKKSFWAGKKILITGGLGFIGSTLAVRLAREGARVAVLDAALSGMGGRTFNLKPVRDAVRLYRINQMNVEKHNPLLRGVSFIFNLAGSVSHVDSLTRPDWDYVNNFLIHQALFEALRKGRRKPVVIFASTRQVYGKPKKLPVDESHPLRPVDPNGIHKLAAEFLHRMMWQEHKIPTLSLRLTNGYGPRQLIRHARQGFVGHFIGLALRGKTIEIFGTGRQKRDFTYVDDIASAFLAAGRLAMRRPTLCGQAYNVGGCPPVTLTRFSRLLLQEAKRKGLAKDRKKNNPAIVFRPFPNERKSIDIGSYFGDGSAFSRLTGWKAQVPLEEGLGKTLDYYRRYEKHYA